MDFKIGDKVKFLNDVGGGVVTRIIDKVLVGVLVDDGFEVPVMASELIKTESVQGNDDLTNETKAADDSSFTINMDKDDNVNLDEFSKDDKNLALYIGIVPRKDEKLEINLINDSNYHVYYTLSSEDEGYYKLVSAGLIEDNTKLKVTELLKDSFLEIDSFSIQAIAFRKGVFTALAPLSKIWKPKKTNFYKDTIFTESDFFHEKA